jgi:arylsulfatase A-like enzyme
MKNPILLTAGALSVATPVIGQAAEQPNVLFIAVDDLKPMIGCYGDKIAVTPNMDKLAEGGTRFDLAYCQAAICGPSRSSLLTGLRPDSSRIMDLKEKIRKIHPEIITLPQHFKNNGYAMAGIGKIFDQRNVINFDRNESWGGNYFHPHFKKRYFEPGKSEVEDQMLAAGKNFWDVRISLTDRGECSNEETKDGSTNMQALQHLRQLSGKDQPFFLAVGYARPHLPFNAPEKYWKLYDGVKFLPENYTGTRDLPTGAPAFAPTPPGTELAAYKDLPANKLVGHEQAEELVHGYYACASFIDDLIGDLLKELDRLGETDNTIIVLWGDHGWHLGDHNGWWAKHSNYEQATRAPLIIRFPKLGKTEPAVSKVVEFTDIYPTLCELAGLDAPDQPGDLTLEGESLVPLMTGTSKHWKNTAFSQFQRDDMMGHTVRTERYRYTGWFKRTAILDPDTEEKEPAYEELYDYKTDPLETRSLVDDPDYKKELNELRKTMQTALEK